MRASRISDQRRRDIATTANAYYSDTHNTRPRRRIPLISTARLSYYVGSTLVSPKKFPSFPRSFWILDFIEFQLIIPALANAQSAASCARLRVELEKQAKVTISKMFIILNQITFEGVKYTKNGDLCSWCLD